MGEALGEYEEHRLKGEREGEDKRAKGKRRPKRTANSLRRKLRKGEVQKDSNLPIQANPNMV